MNNKTHRINGYRRYALYPRPEGRGFTAWWINTLSGTRFIFEDDELQEYKMLKSYEYDDGWLDLTIDSKFLSACVK